MALEPTKRLSNIEGLRLLALVLIIGVHVSSMGFLYAPKGSANWFSANLITTFSRFGVDVLRPDSFLFHVLQDAGPKGNSEAMVGNCLPNDHSDAPDLPLLPASLPR